MKSNKSFTLIELLVVIAVMAGFMALLVPNYMEVRMKSRDTRRKGDLRNIQKALELYKQSQPLPSYPEDVVACEKIEDLNTVYMPKVPQDPKSQCGASVSSYYYVRNESDETRYTMFACLENKNDPEGVVGSCPEAFECGSTNCYQLTEP